MFNLDLINSLNVKMETSKDIPKKLVKLSTDSRSYISGQLFIALRGENFDGFAYAEQILEKECPCIVYTKNEKNQANAKVLQEKYTKTVFISVASTLDFLQELASVRVRQWQKLSNEKVTIGITGSNGKTTNKEMLCHLLDEANKGKVHCTKGNFNNHIGVPLTILDIEDSHDVSIVEMGTNHMGEIQVLCDIANPKYGLITNIGDAHLEFFKTRENIFKEKSSLFHSIKKMDSDESVFILNMDDEYLKTLESKNVIGLGENEGDYIFKYANSEASLSGKDQSFKIVNETMSEKFNFFNLSLTFLLALGIYPNKKTELLEAATSFRLPNNNRSQWILKNNKNIYLDAYNANPSSMKSSLESFVQNVQENDVDLNEVTFILGDMNELGNLAEEMHGEIAKKLMNYGATNVVFVGRYAKYYESAFSANCDVFLEKEDLIQKWPSILDKSQYFFIKASRSLQLESLIDIT